MSGWRSSAVLRLALVHAAALALGIAALGAVVFWSMHLAFERQIDAALASEVASLARRARVEGLDGLIGAIANREAVSGPEQAHYALYDAGGRRIAGELAVPMPAVGASDMRLADPGGGLDRARAVTRDLGGGLRLTVAADPDRLESIDRTLIWAFAVALAGVILLGIFGALAFARLLAGRLGRIAAQAEAIGTGAVSKRMPVSPRGDEFDALATSLNTMLERIEALVENLREVSGALAHDLRTPLARLRQRIEKALGATQEPSQHLLLGAALEQADVVLGLFAAILHLSEVESGAALPKAAFDLTALTGEIAESYEPAVAEGGRTLYWAIDPGVTLVGSRELLAQALSNLVENAIHHTPPGSRISVTLHARDGVASLAVSDNGPGIAEIDRARALRRFERLDPARAAPGFGLGLPLADAVARRHGGHLALDDARPGLIVSIVLPLPCRAAGS